MWDGFSSVDQHYDPIIYEGDPVSVVKVLNAGPGSVELRAWSKPDPGETKPDLSVRMLPGNIRTISGCLVRVGLYAPSDIPPSPVALYSAVGWKYLHFK
jgi:hypothetical protein